MSIITPSSLSNPRALIPPWLKGKWGFLGILFILFTLFNLAWTYFHGGGLQNVVLMANLFSLPPSLLATLLAWRTAAQKSLSIPLRRAWFTLGMSFSMFLMGNLVWAYLEVVLQVEPFPSIADVFYLGFYPLGLWGLLSLPGAPDSRRENLTASLDLLSVLTAATMFVGYFIIVPTAATGNDILTQMLAAAYPIGAQMYNASFQWIEGGLFSTNVGWVLQWSMINSSVRGNLGILCNDFDKGRCSRDANAGSQAE